MLYFFIYLFFLFVLFLFLPFRQSWDIR